MPLTGARMRGYDITFTAGDRVLRSRVGEDHGGNRDRRWRRAPMAGDAAVKLAFTRRIDAPAASGGHHRQHRQVARGRARPQDPSLVEAKT